MTTHITLAEVQAWLERTKLTLTSLDDSMEAQVASKVLARVASAYPTQVSSWVDYLTTPTLLRSIMAMQYAGWFYDRQYSENPEDNSYADRLRAEAESLLVGIIDGTVDVPEVPGLPEITNPEFYPTDASSAARPTWEDPSLGPAKFSMGKIF